jgi:hypothetical protein
MQVKRQPDYEHSQLHTEGSLMHTSIRDNTDTQLMLTVGILLWAMKIDCQIQTDVVMFTVPGL